MVEVEVSHGPEFRAQRRSIKVVPNSVVEVRFALDRLRDMPAAGWFSGDLHVHMNYGGAYRNTPLRLRQHFASAQRVAEFLAGHPAIAYVAYPGLPAHPQHALARRLFDDRGCGAVLAFALDGDADLQNRFVAQLRVITSAVSLGHDESLIVHVGPDGPRAARWPTPFRRYGHLRLSVGLEETDDLLADLDAALEAVNPL